MAIVRVVIGAVLGFVMGMILAGIFGLEDGASSFASLLGAIAGVVIATIIGRQNVEYSRRLADQRKAGIAIVGGLANTRQNGIVAIVGGVLLVVIGAIRWNSLESQFSGLAGKTDGVGVLLLVSGAMALLVGLDLLVGSGAKRGTRAPRSIEDRIRELDHLRTKELITEGEYEERKKQILASI
jgi:uncharacterized membrane protein